MTGKIYWILEDFAFEGNHYPKKDETAHATTKIENIIVDENMIKFVTRPIEYRSMSARYTVNLLRDQHGFTYSGTFAEVSDRDWNGKVSCELFENKKAFFIYGKWTEEDYTYTWWARINKI